MSRFMSLALLFVFITLLQSCHNGDDQIEGYLFAHMRRDDYGSLYYSISRNGVEWVPLDQGNKIDSFYRGHPDICSGRHGEYYMIGVQREDLLPVLWHSENLLEWKVQKKLDQELFHRPVPGYNANPLWYGAPKMFFDEDSDRYIITWHAARNGTGNGPERWKRMRTFYTLTKDFRIFSDPERLFDFDSAADSSMATIDVMIRKTDKGYFALIKDERWPEDCSTGKTIRTAYSNKLTGPYSNPGPPVTPSWYEAPSIVSLPDQTGWILYAENYPHRYSAFLSNSLDGPWKQSEIRLDSLRHGCVIPISSGQYNKLISHFATDINP